MKRLICKIFGHRWRYVGLFISGLELYNHYVCECCGGEQRNERSDSPIKLNTEYPLIGR